MKDFIIDDDQLAGVLGSLDFTKSSCPHCGSRNFVRNGRTGLGRQRYLCRNCRRTFSETTGTPFMYSKKTPRVWASYLFCMEGGLTLREISKILRINLSTAFSWRHKILSVADTKTDTVLAEKIEVNEFWLKENFKGCRKINPLFYDIKMRQLIILLSCRDSQGNILLRVAARKGVRALYKNEIEEVFSPLVKKGSTLVTSRNMAYSLFAKHNRLKFSMPQCATFYIDGLTIENAVAQSRGFLKFLRGFRSVASKYLSHYVNLYRLMLNEDSSLPAVIMGMLSTRVRRLRAYEFKKVQFDGTLRH